MSELHPHSNELSDKYAAFYRQRDAVHVYPVEFVVRSFLGSYPRLARGTEAWTGTRILDLGCGDGRNMPLFANLGMKVHGTEISEEICQKTEERMRGLGIAAEIRVGRNVSIPFETGVFDHLVACHSCYYVDSGTTFDDNLREIARVLKPGGQFVFSAPIPTSYLLRGSLDLGDGYRQVVDDPYGLRNGYVFRVFDTEAEIERVFSPYFDDFRTGSCRNDFWGIEEHVWIGVCRRIESE